MFLKIKHSLAENDTPSMCILSLPDSSSGVGSLGSCSLASGARKVAQACLSDVTTAVLCRE